MPYYPPIKCVWCNLEFLPNRKDKKACSKSCRKHFYKNVKAGYGGVRQRTTVSIVGKSSYRKYKKGRCSFCNFVPIHPCQLDVDHIDGNHSNNDPNNLQTLCANCHRLKTYNQLWNS